jgi:hypothetical protein
MNSIELGIFICDLTARKSIQISPNLHSNLFGISFKSFQMIPVTTISLVINPNSRHDTSNKLRTYEFFNTWITPIIDSIFSLSNLITRINVMHNLTIRQFAQRDLARDFKKLLKNIKNWFSSSAKFVCAFNRAIFESNMIKIQFDHDWVTEIFFRCRVIHLNPQQALNSNLLSPKFTDCAYWKWEIS